MTKNKSLEASLRSVLATDVSRIDPVPRAKEEILQSLLSLIGEDNCTCGCNFKDGCLCLSDNKLRAELRTAIKEWVEGK